MATWTIFLLNIMPIFAIATEKRSGGENMFLLLSSPEKTRGQSETVGFEELESASTLWNYLSLLADSGGKEGTVYVEKSDESETLETDESEEESSSDLEDHEIIKRFFIHDILANDSQEKYVTYSSPSKRNAKQKKKTRAHRQDMRISEGMDCPNPEILRPILQQDGMPRRGKRYPDHLDPIMRYRLLARTGDCPLSEGSQRLFYCPSPSKDGTWKCIEDFQLCDGNVHCPNGEDEMPVPCLFYQVIQNQFSAIKQSIAGQQKPAKPSDNEIPGGRSIVRKKLARPSALLG